MVEFLRTVLVQKQHFEHPTMQMTKPLGGNPSLTDHFVKNPGLVCDETLTALREFCNRKRGKNPKYFYPRIKKLADKICLPNEMRRSLAMLTETVRLAYIIVEQLLCVRERKFRAGMWVRNNVGGESGERMRIKIVQPDGFLQLVGLRGRYRPTTMMPCS